MQAPLVGITKVGRFQYRGGSRTAATSKMERFVITVNSWKPLTIIAKRSILDVAAVLDPPLLFSDNQKVTEADLGLLQHPKWSAL